MSTRLIEFIVDRPKTVWLFVAIATALSTLLFPKIQFDFSPEKVYEGSGDWIQFLEKHRGQFRHEDGVTLVVLEGSGDNDCLSSDALTWLSEFSQLAEKVVHVGKVDSLATMQVPIVSIANRDLRTSPLIREVPVDEDSANMIRRRVDKFDLINDTLISRDRRFAVTMIVMKENEREMQQMRDLVSGLEIALQARPIPDGYKLHMTGVPAIRTDIVRNLQADQLIMFPAATVMFLLVLYYLFRSIPVTLVGLAAVLCGLIWCFAAIALSGLPFTLLTNVVPTLLLIIGAANAVHVASRYAEELERHGPNVREATIVTVREMSLTCALTFGTTAIGFGSLMMSDSFVLRSFSMQSAIGLLCTYVSIMMCLAVGFPLVHESLKQSYAPTASSRLVGIATTFSRYVVKAPWVIMAVSLCVVLGAAMLASRLKINSHMFEVYDESHPTVQTLQLIEDNLSGVMAMEVNFAAEDSDAFLTAGNYRSVAEFADYARELEGVAWIRSHVDIHQAAWAASKRKPELRTQLPGDDQAGADQLARSTGIIRKLGESSRIDLFLNEEEKSARMLIRVRDIGSAKLKTMIASMETKLAELFPKSTGITPRLTGDAFLFAKSMDRFVREMFFSLLTASIVIFGVISLLFKSIRFGVISILPNITPLLITLGYMYLRGYDMTVGNVIVFAIGIGIAVDDTIHFLARFREEIAAGKPTIEAISQTMLSTGRAIVLTTVLIVTGLSVLILSAFVPTQRFAELTGITMASALFGDLLMLPACLLLFWKQRNVDAEGAASEASKVT